MVIICKIKVMIKAAAYEEIKTRHSFFDELFTALKISWLVISAIVFIVILGWIFFGDAFINDLSNQLQNNHSDIKCFFCGMTEAFLKIRDANFLEAILINNNSIQVFIFLFTNQILYIFFLIKKTD